MLECSIVAMAAVVAAAVGLVVTLSVYGYIIVSYLLWSPLGDPF